MPVSWAHLHDQGPELERRPAAAGSSPERELLFEAGRELAIA